MVTCRSASTTRACVAASAVAWLGGSMAKQTLIVKQGQAQALTVLGTEVRFLCDADATDHAWSLMELVVPRDAGPPPHEHNWDEAYYVTEGCIQFSIGARSVLATTG